MQLSVLRHDAEALQPGLRVYVVGIELQRRAVVGDSIVALAKLLVDFRPGLYVGGIVGCQRDGLIGVGQAFGVLALKVIVPGALVINIGIIRFERDYLGEIGDGLVVEALLRIGDAAIEIDIGVNRQPFDCLDVIGNGLVVEALVVIGVATTEVVGGESLDRLLRNSIALLALVSIALRRGWKRDQHQYQSGQNPPH